MSKCSTRVKIWRAKTKQRIVAALGGKCVICGYDTCIANLVPHHIDTKTKEFGMSSMLANPKNWARIASELKKCVLVCANCHGEIHYNDLKLPPVYAKFDDRYADIHYDNTSIDKCVCGKEKMERYAYCSKACATKHAPKIDWASLDLEELLSQYTVDELTIILHCSNAAIYKKAKKLGLLIHKERICGFCKKPFESKSIDQKFCSHDCARSKRKKLPLVTRDDLVELLKTYSYVQIAKQLKVSDKTVAKYAKQFGILK